jgi:hypothetical protein
MLRDEPDDVFDHMGHPTLQADIEHPSFAGDARLDRQGPHLDQGVASHHNHDGYRPCERLDVGGKECQSLIR